MNVRHLLLPIGILCAVALRLTNLDRGYSGDEITLIVEASQPLAQFIPFIEKTGTYPPVTHLLLKVWMLLSTSEQWVRLYFVLNGTLLCLVLYKLGKYLGGRAVGLTCLFAAAVSPMLVWASQFVRPYGDSALWTLLAVYCLLRAADTKQEKWWAGYAFSALIVFYMAYYTVLVVAAFSAGMLFAYPQKVGLRRWLVVHVLIGIAVLPWLGIAYKQLVENAPQKLPWQHIGVTWGGLHLGTLVRGLASISGLDPYAIPAGLTIDTTVISWPAVVVPLMCVVSFLWLLGVAWFRGGLITRVLIAASIIPLGVGILTDRFFSLPPTPKYQVAPHGLALVAVVAGCWPQCGSAPWLGWFRRPVALASVLGLTSVLAISLAFALRYPVLYLPEYDFKAAFSLLHQRAESGDCLVTFGGLPSPGATGLYHVAFSPYLDRDRETGMFSGPDEHYSREISERLRACQRVWGLEYAGPHETFRGNERLRVWLLRSGYHEVEVKRLIRVRLTLFVHSAPSP